MSPSVSFVCQGLGVGRETSRAGLTAPTITLCPWPVSPSAMVSGSDASPEIKLALIMLQLSAHPLALRPPGRAECRVWREATWPHGSWSEGQGVWARKGGRRHALQSRPSLVVPLLFPRSPGKHPVELSGLADWYSDGVQELGDASLHPCSRHFQCPAHTVPANAGPTTSFLLPVPGMLLEAFSWQREHAQPTHQAGWKCWQVSTPGTDLMDKYSNLLAQEWDNRGGLYAVSQRSPAGLNTNSPRL